MVNELIYKDEVYAIQGAIFEVYREMGNAWHEEVYQQCLERELALRGVLPGDGERPVLDVAVPPAARTVRLPEGLPIRDRNHAVSE